MNQHGTLGLQVVADQEILSITAHKGVHHAKS